MTRKFTPPTTFPAEYATAAGEIVTLMAESDKAANAYYIGIFNGDWHGFHKDGRSTGLSIRDLHDIPKTRVAWANDYFGSIGMWVDSRLIADRLASEHTPRAAVIRREWTEGQLPQYFTEEV